jgi:hypothetical protein
MTGIAAAISQYATSTLSAVGVVFVVAIIGVAVLLLARGAMR